MWHKWQRNQNLYPLCVDIMIHTTHLNIHNKSGGLSFSLSWTMTILITSDFPGYINPLRIWSDRTGEVRLTGSGPLSWFDQISSGRPWCSPPIWAPQQLSIWLYSINYSPPCTQLLSDTLSAKPALIVITFSELNEGLRRRDSRRASLLFI